MNTQERACKSMESTIVQFERGDYAGTFISFISAARTCAARD